MKNKFKESRTAKQFLKSGELTLRKSGEIQLRKIDNFKSVNSEGRDCKSQPAVALAD